MHTVSNLKPKLYILCKLLCYRLLVIHTSDQSSLRFCQVCGQADVWGDGVVPEVSAHLEGALNISLDGVYHSPVGSDDTIRPWYGSPGVLEQWIEHLLN
jgi:hypothetical protein